jgi:TrfA protein
MAETFTPLTSWNKSDRVIPLGLAVTSLFSANARTDGVEFLDQVIKSREGAVIKYSGPSLLVDDMDVLMAVTHVARGSQLQGDVLQIQSSFSELLEVLDWPSQTSYYDRLDASLMRLSRAHIAYTQRGGPSGRRVTMRVFGTILGVTKTIQSGDARQRTISTPISKDMLLLWGSLIQIPWDQRRGLKRALSRWLQIYVIFGSTSMREYLVEELYEMSRFTGEKSEFRRRLKDASDELQKHGYFSSYNITTEMAVFYREVKLPDTPRQKHLAFEAPLSKGAAAFRTDLFSLTQSSIGD